VSNACFFTYRCDHRTESISFPTRRSSDLIGVIFFVAYNAIQSRAQLRFFVFWTLAMYALFPVRGTLFNFLFGIAEFGRYAWNFRSEEHTSELQSRENLVCRLLLEKKNAHV